MTLLPTVSDARELVVDDLSLSTSVGDCARVLQLNRPRRRNALTTSLLEELVRQIDRALDDSRVRALVLCGSGGTFCAGGDITEFAGVETDRDGVMTRSGLMLEVAAKLEQAPIPTLAVVAGAAAGGGAVLALACDMIIAGEDMRLGFPELRNSVVPSLVMPSALATFGRRGAFDLLTSGRPLDARELVERGIVDRIVELDNLREATADVLGGWAAVPREAMAATKELLHAMAKMSPAESVSAALDATATLWKPRSN